MKNRTTWLRFHHDESPLSVCFDLDGGVLLLSVWENMYSGLFPKELFRVPVVSPHLYNLEEMVNSAIEARKKEEARDSIPRIVGRDVCDLSFEEGEGDD